MILVAEVVADLGLSWHASNDAGGDGTRGRMLDMPRFVEALS
jgi:hypothetical protein